MTGHSRHTTHLTIIEPGKELLMPYEKIAFVASDSRQARDALLILKDRYKNVPAAEADVIVAIAPDSERLQALEPWPAWDGRDVSGAPVLVKAKGKTTTDQISPAGPWLRLRGHLDHFSDNMFMGAINAFTDERGAGLDVLSGAVGQGFSRTARHYRAEGLPWVVVGDTNYGEGSSREHAALSPRLLGCAAVIVRSFARIHETNLKKQGLLALTFKTAADYDRIREDDRISLVGLSEMAPGAPVECRIRHADRREETIALVHSYTEAQLEWFRAGSALNVLAAQAG